MKNNRAFEITYHGPTNFRPSRVKIDDLRFNKTKFISYDYELNNIFDMAKNYLKSIGIECLNMAESKKGYLLLTDNFKTELR